MKRLIISTMILAAVCLSACKKFSFWDDEDPKPKDECVDPSKACKDCACPMIYSPVCGCDGKTYGNACEAKASGVTKYTEGACGQKPCIDPNKVDPDGACTKEYNPVCGCDGVTYPNPCNAEKAGVTSYRAGTCSSVYLKDVITYSWTGGMELDGCGSLMYKDNGELLVPESESQIPDSVRNLVTIAPARYIIVYEVVKHEDRWQCGMSIETRKATIVRIKEIYPA